MITAVVDGQAYTIHDEDPTMLVGIGGEADVFRFIPSAEFVRRYGNHQFVLKLFRKATAEAKHSSNPAAARAQLRADDNRQLKLKEFPKGLPDQVIAPIALAYDGVSRVIGYVMVHVTNATPLIEYKTAKFRRENSITLERILRIMANLYKVVAAVHACGVVIGDFNDKNVLVLPDDTVYLLDADSFQFGRWECTTFVNGFVDPQIVEPREGSPKAFKKIGSHTRLTDLYALMVMLFQLTVRVHPYTDGFCAGVNGEGQVPEVQRIHQRLSVFHDRVSLPDIATPFDRLPADIVDCFRQVFVEGKRGVLPPQILNGTTPPAQSAPSSSTSKSPPSQTRQAAASTTHRPARTLLAVSLQGGQPRYVTYHEGAYRREGGQAFWSTPYDSRLTAIPAGHRTVMASDKTFVIFDGARHSDTVDTQAVFGRTTVAANSRHIYWLRESELVRDDTYGGTVSIGKVAANSTSIWVGERFGIALLRAGIFKKILVFTEYGGFRTLTLPTDFGSIVDVQCAIGDQLAWLTLSTSSGGRTVNQCYVVDAAAQLRATATATPGDNTWLGSFNSAAHATGDKLLIPVPRIGVVRVGIAAERARQELVYPGTSALVPDEQSTVGLTYSHQGIQHFGFNSISQIAMSL